MNHGKIHNYLGSDFDFSEKGRVHVSMIQYLTNIFDNFIEEIGDPMSAPSGDNLFNV